MKKIAAALAFLLAATLVTAIDPAEVIRRMEANQVHTTASYEGRMVITDDFGSRTKTFKAYSMGADKMLVEFTNPEEAGQKILRTGDDISLYFPDAEEVIRLQGSALKDSVMGSDFSYEDFTGEKGLLDLYTVKIEGTESLDGKDCFVLSLAGKKKDISYPIQRMWVDSELFVMRKVSSFSLSGKPLKVMTAGEIRTDSGKTFPTLFSMRDLMKKKSSTVFQITKITINAPLDPKLFSREELSW
jgi:outer membrane lipoprotein-sorting protein